MVSQTTRVEGLKSFFGYTKFTNSTYQMYYTRQSIVAGTVSGANGWIFFGQSRGFIFDPATLFLFRTEVIVNL